MAADPHTMFERALLDSARGDAEPRDVGAAWSRFAVALDQAGVGQDDGGARAAASAPPRAGLAPAAPAGRVITWLVIGALGGAGATAMVLGRRRSEAPLTRAEPVRAALPAEPGPVSVPPAIARPTADGDAAAERARPARRHVVRQSSEPSSSSARLAAEVIEIDAARAANARGEYDQAIRLVGSYHRRFPAGVLAADAELVALDAAAARRDRAEVTRRASLFLSRHPHDPHAARVRQLAAEAGRGAE